MLLIRYHRYENWSLPGGFIQREEALTHAVYRILAEKTNITDLFLRQFYALGDSPSRINRIEIQKNHNNTYAKAHVALTEDHWLAERTLSVGYYVLVEYEHVRITPDFLVEEYRCCAVSALPQLQYEHNEIVDKTLAALRSQAYQQPIARQMLPAKFTLPISVRICPGFRKKRCGRGRRRYLSCPPSPCPLTPCLHRPMS